MRKISSASSFLLLLIWLIVYPVPSAADGARVPRVEETGIRFGSGDLREPVGLAVDLGGFVYVADAMAGKVFRYAPDGESLEFERPGDGAAFYPIDVAVQESFALVLDYSRNAILRYDLNGAFLDVLLSFGEFERMRPVSITAGAGGRIITTDVENDAVALWTPLLDLEFVIGEFGRGDGSFNEPRKAVFLPDQGIAVVESGNRRIQIFSPAGRYERTVSPLDSAFVSPRSVCVDDGGNLYACDAEEKRVAVFSADGSHLFDIDSFARAAIAPAAVVTGWDGALYVADIKSRSILVYRLVPPRDE